MGFREVLLGAIGYLFEYRWTLAKALLIPFVAFMAIDATELLPPNWIVAGLAAVVTVIVNTIFAIITHRVILLGPKAVPEWGIIKWSWRETLFTLHILALGAVVVLIGLVAMMLDSMGIVPLFAGSLMFVFACWTVSRLSLVFPGIAINEGVTFGLSWKMTKDRQLLMFLVVIVVPLATLIPIVPLALIPYSFALTSFLSTLTTVLTVAALSVAYKVIRKEYYGS